MVRPKRKFQVPERLRAARHMLTRRPKVAANLAPPSYCSTSATVNRLATPDPNPMSVPRDFGRKFEDFRRKRCTAPTNLSGGITKPFALTRGTFRILQRQPQL